MTISCLFFLSDVSYTRFPSFLDILNLSYQNIQILERELPYFMIICDGTLGAVVASSAAWSYFLI